MGSDWNPYWDAVKDHINYDGLMRQRCVLPRHPDYPDDEHRAWPASTELRRKLVPRYTWTVTDPETVAFVAEHAGATVIDPMAGTGYWARLLADRGALALAYDQQPPDGTEANHWHQEATPWTRILPGEAPDTVAAAGPNVTLLLSWPPYNTGDGTDAVRAYTGSRIIYIGEGEGGCTGDDALHKLLATEWTEVDHHCPVQWWGIHDMIYVYDRAS